MRLGKANPTDRDGLFFKTEFAFFLGVSNIKTCIRTTFFLLSHSPTLSRQRKIVRHTNIRKSAVLFSLSPDSDCTSSMYETFLKERSKKKKENRYNFIISYSLVGAFLWRCPSVSDFISVRIKKEKKASRRYY